MKKFDIQKKTFIHQNIPYSFNINKSHRSFQTGLQPQILQFGSKHNDFNKLFNHFNRVIQGKIPNHFFNSKNFPRISQFKIRGIKTNYLDFFTKKLIRSGKIQKYDKNSKLPKLTQSVFDTFSERNKKPGHNPVLKNILIKDEHSIAIETPIWKEFQDTCLTGHIDLIQIENKTVKVIDYKPEGKFIVSLPQVAMYGLLIKNLFDIKDLKCLSFNKKETWEYDPLILFTDIKEFLDAIHIKEREWERFI